MVADGYVPQESEDTHVNEDWIGEGYFSTMGIPLLSGREFTASDTATSPSGRSSAKELRGDFFGRNPVGMTSGSGRNRQGASDIEIVKDS